MSNNLRKVVMSKTVAEAYLSKISEVSDTITVYFNDASTLVKFRDKLASDFSGLNTTTGYDYVIFITNEKSVAAEIVKRAEGKNLDYTDI